MRTTLARELEEANVMIEEQYASMAEELEAKTRKLKKVWNKYQAAQQEHHLVHNHKYRSWS